MEQGKLAPEVLRIHFASYALKEPLSEAPLGVVGYYDSKWASEHLVVSARKTGLKTFVFRPDFIVGSSESGRSNIDDTICRVMKTTTELDIAPDGAFLVNPKNFPTSTF